MNLMPSHKGYSHNRSRYSKKNIRRQKMTKLMEDISHERVEYLFHQAELIHRENLPLANRYVSHARNIAMASKIHIPRALKRHVCHGCKGYLYPGTTAQIRYESRKRYGSYLLVRCLECGFITRYLYKGPNFKLERLQLNPSNE